MEKTHLDPDKKEEKPVKKSTNTGMAGLVAGETRITTVGAGIGLNHRGYNITDFVGQVENKDNPGCFEELCYLLLCAELPTAENLKVFKEAIAD